MKKLNPDKFTFDLWEPSYEILNLDYYLIPFGTDPTYLKRCDEKFVKALKEKAIGYCEASSLMVRPRAEGYAILCEGDDGRRGWFHIDEDIFKKVCEG